VKDFFISYNQADRAWAEWIAWELEALEREKMDSDSMLTLEEYTNER
jgi:hypothetical protein